ncbi:MULTISPECIES: hypothetical protein [Dyella]|uniref:Uncharacterized protein n=2 Tax=Dyella TaxID=231454 RepID=A0A4R0YPZ6_9GAMM|nr:MULTISPECIES: hypothetical protein [Dyella]TBR35821.1 hypothetical protein EYV96_17665 [Dyella terrae]TCI08631.1 hypothetical protein EZM97_28890 [Dyella soli]
MSVFKQVNRVREAQARVVLAREAVAEPATALLDRARGRPLTTVGVATGLGFVLGQLGVHPLRVPGLGALLSGSAAELVTQAVHLVSEFSQGGFDRS